MPNIELVDATKRVLSWLSQREVKTPLSFFFRLAGYFTLIVIVMVIWGSSEMQPVVLLGGAVLLVLVFIAVVIFAWHRPKNLVYGETGHRAEMKLGLGTESRTFSSAEIATLPGTEKPAAALPAGGETQ